MNTQDSSGNHTPAALETDGGATTDARGLLVIVCTFNEIGNLPTLSEALARHLPGCHVLVVDDGSPDGTGRWAGDRAADQADFSCIHRAGKFGLGSATMEGMRWGLAREYRWIATLDADFSHDPAAMPDLLRAMAGYGSKTGVEPVAIGSRYVAGGRISGWPARRRWISRLVNGMARGVLRLPVHDCSGAMRIYPVNELRRLGLESIRAPGYAYLEELLFRLHRQGTPMIEVPIHFRDRTLGRSKATWREGLGKLTGMVRLRFGG